MEAWTLYKGTTQPNLPFTEQVTTTRLRAAAITPRELLWICRQCRSHCLFEANQGAPFEQWACVLSLAQSSRDSETPMCRTSIPPKGCMPKRGSCDKLSSRSLWVSARWLNRATWPGRARARRDAESRHRDWQKSVQTGLARERSAPEQGGGRPGLPSRRCDDLAYGPHSAQNANGPNRLWASWPRLERAHNQQQRRGQLGLAQDRMRCNRACMVRTTARAKPAPEGWSTRRPQCRAMCFSSYTVSQMSQSGGPLDEELEIN